MNKLTHATVGLLERRWLKTATVLAVRNWEPATIIEVDLHMPDQDMSKWQRTQHMKCKVGPLAYRDYSPTGWDAGTRTCTLLIDAGHEGQGSRWVRELKAGDVVQYMGVASSHHEPTPGKRMVFLGDETAIGHFLSLQQLAGYEARIDGAITIAHKNHRDAFKSYFSGLGLQPLDKDSSDHARALEDWISALEVHEDDATVFYLAGYIPAVTKLRRLLKAKGYSGSQIKCQGFWN